MISNIKPLKLVKGNDGRFILSKEAVSIIRKAKRITISYNKDVKSESYIMAELETNKYGETFEFSYIMPINVLEQQYQFRSTIACHTKHPLQELIKTGSVIVFIPSISEEIQHTIRYLINTNGKISNGIFEQRIFKPGIKAVMINKND